MASGIFPFFFPFRSPQFQLHEAAVEWRSFTGARTAVNGPLIIFLFFFYCLRIYLFTVWVLRCVLYVRMSYYKPTTTSSPAFVRRSFSYPVDSAAEQFKSQQCQVHNCPNEGQTGNSCHHSVLSLILANVSFGRFDFFLIVSPSRSVFHETFSLQFLPF